MNQSCPVLVRWRGEKSFGYTAEFRHAEFRSVAQTLIGLSGDSITFTNALASEPQGDDGYCEEGALEYVFGCTAEDATRVAASCVLVRQLHEVLATGDTVDECATSAAEYPFDECERTAGLCRGDTWKLRQRDFRYKNRSRGRAPPDPEVLEKLACMTAQFPGDVDLRDPQHTLCLLKGNFRSADEANGGRQVTRSGGTVYLSLMLTEGRRQFHEYRLSDRRYLSTTTMDNETAFIMANVAGVMTGSTVCDPFCGSGGILLAAGALGAKRTTGIDVDSSLDTRGIQSNFDQRGLQTSFSLLHGDLADDVSVSAAICSNGGHPFDAVVSDPPYGRREGKRSDSDGGGRVRYQMAAADAVHRLSELCARREGFLAVGGKLVYFVPTSTRCAHAATLIPHLPQHPSLRLLHVLKQPVNNRLVRWLVVMEKVAVGVEDEPVVQSLPQVAAYQKRHDKVAERQQSLIGYDFKGMDMERARDSRR